MAGSSSVIRSKVLQHGRSLSFPANSSHPSTTQFDENLSTLTSSEATTSSLSSMTDNISTLRKLYGNIDDLLQLPHIHHVLSQDCQQKTDQILDNHVRLLDACSSAKDLVSQTKQDVHQLLSSLRRKDVQGIQSYISLRKRSKKMIEKSLKNIKSFENKQSPLTSENDHELRMLREAEPECSSSTFSTNRVYRIQVL